MGHVRDGAEGVLSGQPMDLGADSCGGQLRPADYQWNFRVGVIDGAAITVAVACADPTTVLSWFLAQLGASNILISLVQLIRMGSSFLLQILVSGYLQRKPLKMPFCLTIAALRVLLLAAMALVVALVPVASPRLVAAFSAAPTTYSLVSGTLIAGMSYLLDIVPEAGRTLYLGFNNTLFGIARMSALASGFLINCVGFKIHGAVVAAFCVLSLMLASGLADPLFTRDCRMAQVRHCLQSSGVLRL